MPVPVCWYGYALLLDHRGVSEDIFGSISPSMILAPLAELILDFLIS